MRLFIAIGFDAENRVKLSDLKKKIESNSIRGRFVSEDQYHLTLAFLGEVSKERISILRETIAKVDFHAFFLTARNLSRFKRENGDIIFAQVEKNSELLSLYKRLTERLNEEGFWLEKRSFKPHLTLGRAVFLKQGFDLGAELFLICQKVETVYLMRSERVDGKMKYTVLYKKRCLIR